MNFASLQHRAYQGLQICTVFHYDLIHTAGNFSFTWSLFLRTSTVTIPNRFSFCSDPIVFNENRMPHYTFCNRLVLWALEANSYFCGKEKMKSLDSFAGESSQLWDVVLSYFPVWMELLRAWGKLSQLLNAILIRDKADNTEVWAEAHFTYHLS